MAPYGSVHFPFRADRVHVSRTFLRSALGAAIPRSAFDGEGGPLAEVLRAPSLFHGAGGCVVLASSMRGKDRSRECVLPSDGAEIPDEMDEI